MYPHHVFDLEPAGTFGMYPICYHRVSGRYFQPEPAMYSRCFRWFPGPLAPSVRDASLPTRTGKVVAPPVSLTTTSSYGVLVRMIGSGESLGQNTMLAGLGARGPRNQ